MDIPLKRSHSFTVVSFSRGLGGEESDRLEEKLELTSVVVELKEITTVRKRIESF